MSVTFVFLMFVVVGCALLLRSLSMLSPILKYRTSDDAQRALFDTSRGEREARKTYDVLTMALVQSSTDAEFEASFRRLLKPCTDRAIQNSWVLIRNRLFDYRRPGDAEYDFRNWAERYLKDLSRQHRFGR